MVAVVARSHVSRGLDRRELNLLELILPDYLENPRDHRFGIGAVREVGTATERVEAKRSDSDDDVGGVAAVENRAARVAVARSTLAVPLPTVCKLKPALKALFRLTRCKSAISRSRYDSFGLPFCTCCL